MDKKAIIKALRDTAQSASNAIASNVSGPVDLIAAGLRGVGLPIPQNPVGGSQWMAERGLTRDVEMGAPRIIGETLGMAGPALAVAKAPQIAAGLNAAADMPMQAAQAAERYAERKVPEVMARGGLPAEMLKGMASNTQSPLTVWHGSPHKFDKFDASKIGTGEGAQAYGHGLYLAESPDVAKAYQESLSQENINALGRIFTPEDLKKLPDAQRAAISAGSVQGVSGNLKRAQAMLDEGLDPKWVADFIRYSNELNSHPLGRQTTGQLYKVDLPDEQIAKMLDWDKPLSQQSKEVQNAILKIRPNIKSLLNEMNQTGEDFVNWMGRGHSDRLLEAGIPGIRYLDSGSRGVPQQSFKIVSKAGGFESPLVDDLARAQSMLSGYQKNVFPDAQIVPVGNKLSSNFVVFPGNEHMLQILERNGQPLGLMGIK